MAARLTSRLTQHPIFAAKGNTKGSEGSLMSLVFHPPPSHTRGAAHGTMKLLTHNLLQSPGTRHGYPLAIEAEKVETVEIGRCRERVLASLQAYEVLKRVGKQKFRLHTSEGRVLDAELTCAFGGRIHSLHSLYISLSIGPAVRLSRSE